MAGDDAAPSEELPEAAEPSRPEVPEPDGLQSEDRPAGTSHLRLGLIVGLVVVVALAGLTGWLGYRANQSRELEQRRQTFLQVARQGATDLTTLNYEHIDADVQRILDTSTGTYYDDFQKRAASFTDVVKQLKSTSVGTVTEAALEPDDSPTAAHVLVDITVKSHFAGQPEQDPRAMRMRVEVQKIDDDTKVSDVEYVQ